MVVPRTDPAPRERPPLDPTYLAMAAAVMEAKGKFKPKEPETADAS